MPLGGLLAYLKELGPVSLGAGGENDLVFQDADGDITSGPARPRQAGEEDESLGIPDDEQAEGELGVPEDTLLRPEDEGLEGFPGTATGGSSKMMAAVQGMLGGFRGR